MKEKKLTKREKFEMVKAYVADNEMLMEFIDNEINLLTKKASSSAKTKTQIENEGIKDKIVATLKELDRPVLITELQNANTELATYSNQKISALLTQLVNANIVKREVDKKKAYFTLAD